MARIPEWVARLEDVTLKRDFGVPTFMRGRDYADRGMVGMVQTDDRTLSGAVTGGRVYRVRVNGGHGFVGGSCTCPMQVNCKHVVAVILSVRDSAEPQTPGWHRAFADVVAETARAASGAAHGILITRGPRGFELRLRQQSASGAWPARDLPWAGGGTVVTADPAQAAAVASVGSEFSGDPFVLARPLERATPGIWTALRDAIEAGVTLLPGDRIESVRLSSEPARAVSAYEPRPDGSIVVTTGLDHPETDEPSALIVGYPGHGVVYGDRTLLLAPLDRALTTVQRQVVERSRQVIVPAGDVARFVATVHPHLTRAFTVRVPSDLKLPVPEAPRLVLDVTWRADERTADLAWSFHYRTGSDDIAVALDGGSDEAIARDARAERDLLATLGGTGWAVDDRLRPRERETLIGPAMIALGPRLARLRRVGIEVVAHGDEPDLREADAAPVVEFSVTDSDHRDWFDLDVTVTVDGHSVPFATLFAALASGDEVMILDDGTWFPLDTPELADLRRLIDEASGLLEGESGSYRIRVDHAGLWEDLVASGVVSKQSQAWQAAVRRLLEPGTVPAPPVPIGLTGTLRSYQRTGFEWLAQLWETRLGGILADDMGLGKTVQALALITSLVERGEADGPVLVVAPTSVIGTWAAEAARFAPGLRVVRVEQTAAKREPLAVLIEGADVIVTSYTLVRLGSEEFQAVDWSLVLLDEAQFVKNRASRTYHAVRRLRSRMKVAMTGTPLENSLMDLWSLVSITAPGLFTDPTVFDSLYRRPIESGDTEKLARLRRRIRPLMLRRTKDTVATELPPKQETLIPVPLSAEHRRAYDKELHAQRRRVLGLVSDMKKNRVAVLAALTRLRRLALSPALVDGGPAVSAKLDALVEMVTELAAEGHRALVFSQFTSYLRLAEARLRTANLATVYLDGRTRDRESVITAWRTGTAPVFLISLKAGGFGLTLTEADYVFVLDPWWNPAAEAQAVDRTHRIGQELPVNVYRLVSEGTIEEKVIALQERKRDLFTKVVGSDDAAFTRPLTADDIRGLLEP